MPLRQAPATEIEHPAETGLALEQAPPSAGFTAKLDAEAVTLTELPGVGGVLARRLRDAGLAEDATQLGINAATVAGQLGDAVGRDVRMVRHGLQDRQALGRDLARPHEDATGRTAARASRRLAHHYR